MNVETSDLEASEAGAEARSSPCVRRRRRKKELESLMIQAAEPHGALTIVIRIDDWTSR